MAQTAIGVRQTVENCRWSRPGVRFTGWSPAHQPEGEWVCTRDGQRRDVTPRECATCAQWAKVEEPCGHSRAVAIASQQPLTPDVLLAGISARHAK